MNLNKQNPNCPGEVLIVDDTPASLQLLFDVLTQAGYAVRQAQDGEMALLSAIERPPELVLLDIRMPGIDGYEVCRQLKASPRTHDVPVIFLSAMHETEDKVQGFKLGAVTNSSSSFVESVVMFERGHAPEARRVARVLGIRQVRLMTSEIGSAAAGAPVAVIVGEDNAATTG